MMIDPIALIFKHKEEMDRRMRRMIWQGTVTHVDHKLGLIRVDDGMGTEDEGGGGGGGGGGGSGGGGGQQNKNLTDWVPWCEHAGAIKTRSMPSVGQTVTMFCPSGEPGQGFAMHGTYNAKNKMPKAENGEHVTINGTSKKMTTKRGPEYKPKGNDNADASEDSESPWVKAAMKWKSDGDGKKNKTAKGNHEEYHGPLEKDEGSWGNDDDGTNKSDEYQFKPDEQRKAYAEHSHDGDQTDKGQHQHYATDGQDKKSQRNQVAGNISRAVGDGADADSNQQVQEANASYYHDDKKHRQKIGGTISQTDEKSIQHVGETYSGMGALDQEGKPVVGFKLTDAKQLFTQVEIPDPQGPPGKVRDPKTAA